MQELPNHLGGHKNRTHLDDGSLTYMINTLKIKSMLDIGCGPGGMVKLAREKGLEAYGIDGDFQVDRSGIDKNWITLHDYETGSSSFDKMVDLIWSCEFVEHVYEKFLPNFMKDFQRGKFVVMTYAPPGKPGHHHVNCNTEDYWKGVFKDYGFQFDADMTGQIREVTTMNIKGKSAPRKAFIKNHGLFFVKL